MRTKQSIESTLGKYLPEAFIAYVVELMKEHPVHFRITRPRSTKFGDFRAKPAGLHQITVNGNLNPFAFLITCIHEFAHLSTYKQYGNRVSPHGTEWKNEFARMLVPVIASKQLPEELDRVLIRSLSNIKASSCSDKHLYRTLLSYDKHPEGIVPLEHIQRDSLFQLQGRLFRKGKLQRTRYLCQETNTQRMYHVSALALVKQIQS